MNKIFLFCIIIIALYILPSFVQYHYSNENHILGMYLGLPITQTGDEPHYYITLYSLVNDDDFFLTNNYNNAFYNNGSDLGTKKYDEFNRHTRIYDSVNGKVTNIPIIDNSSMKIDLKYVPNEKSSEKEILAHFVGLPTFAFIFLWPFKNTAYLEHFAIYLTLIFSLLGILAFYRLMIFYHKNEEKVILFTVLFAFATQYWYYSKTFWVEPYLTSFFIMAWYFIIVKKDHFTSGSILGMGFLMKPTFILIIVPFYLFLILNKRRKVSNIVKFSIPLIIIFLIFLIFNYYLRSNFLQFDKSITVSFSHLMINVFHWMFNSVFGLITFSPVLMFSFLGIANFWKKDKIQFISLILAIILNILFFSIIMDEHAPLPYGPGGYSARYLIPLIPAFSIICSFVQLENKALRKIFYLLLIISILINFLSVFAYPAFTGYDVRISFEKLVKFIV